MTDSSTEVLTEKVQGIDCAKCGKPLDVSQFPSFSKFRCAHCGAVQTVPARLGNFLLQQLLGKGGMGAVYQAIDQQLGRPVAIKVMLRSIADDREAFEQFRREAQAAAALNHPSIVQIYSLGEAHSQPYIVMELLSGGRLDQMIAGGKPLDEARVMKIAVEVAEGLNAANGIGLVHGDIKPENILLDAKGTAKVVDFGLARFKDRDASRDGVWGTPYYIAPEKVRRQPGDARSDIYSLGATLFHALAGVPPFDGQTPIDVVKARLEQPAPDLAAIRPDLRPEVCALVARMLEAHPMKRYPTYASLLADLVKITGGVAPPPETAVRKGGSRIVIKGKGGAVSAPLSGPPTGAYPGAVAAAPKPKKSRKKLWVVLILLFVLFGAIGAGIYVLVGARHRRASERDEAARLAKAKAAVSNSYEAVLASVTGVLDSAEELFFLGETATGVVQQARAILDKMGPQTNYVSVPSLPSDEQIFSRIEPAVVGAFPALASLEAIRSEAEKAFAEAQSATGAAQGAALDARLRELAGQAAAPGATLSDARSAAWRVVDEAKAIVKRAEEARETGAKEADRLAALEAEKQRRAAAEAEKKRIEAEHKARIAAELEQVRGAWDASLATIKENDFDRAAAGLKRDLANLETDEGKTAAQAAIERAVLLGELKVFLVESLHAKPYSWGWIAGPSPVDITDATAEVIKVRGRDEPWSKADVRQMMKFVNRFVPEAQKSRRELARLNLAAAVFCYVHGGMAPAKDFAAKAGQADSRLADEVKRLMPDLPKDEE